MRKRLLGAWIGALVTVACATAATEAAAQNCLSSNPKDWPPPARPYFMLVVDTSDSMNWTGAAANSCKIANGYPSNYIDTANGAVRCAMTNVLKAFAGEVNFGLAQFGIRPTGCSATCFTNCAAYPSGSGAWCNNFSLLVPIDPDPLPVGQTPNTATLLSYCDNNCAQTTTVGGVTYNVEVWGNGNTPLGGVLTQLRTYFQGTSSPLTAADPVCRPVHVILLTDGAETCSGDAVTAATNLYAGVTFGGKTFRIITDVIDAANATPTAFNQSVATAGHGVARGATSEAALAQAYGDIISSAIKPEECDNVDNNCNGCVDEGYKHYCNRGRTGVTNPTNDSQCCSAARATCYAQYAATQQKWWLPCYTPTGNLDLPLSVSTSWVCGDPGDRCDNADNNCEGTTPNASQVDEGVVKCNGQCTPPAETCNGQDDNCDGVVDNASGSNIPFSLTNCQPCTPSAELCDGCDNDCDGVADNGVLALTCGLPTPPNCVGTLACMPQQNVSGPGKCIGSGPTNRWGTCSNSPTNEVCNGLDDNCNGLIDDGVAPTPCTIPGMPGLVYSDTNPLSQCVKGQTPCNGQCSGWIGPSAEICDGIDNDCDGLVDKADSDMSGIGSVCGSSMGVCSKGQTDCVAGVLVCVGGTQPGPEFCDGLDNDCNGYVDDGVLGDAPGAGLSNCWDLPASGCNPLCSFTGAHNTVQWCPPAGATCTDVGTLLSPPCFLGSLVCQGGGWKCVGGAAPSPEICDGIDNDCNGSADEGLAQPVCGSNVGECKQGIQQCVGGVVSCVGSIDPTQEICDGKDNDCDGTIDNGITVGAPCPAPYDTTQYPGVRDKGECKPGAITCDAQGQQVCQGGQGPQPEVCDGKDNDCDGAVDEEGTAPDGINGTTDPTDPNNTIGGTCGTTEGACEPGKWACSNGKFVCSGGVGPQTEVCDCVDNDCDGKIDEDPTPSTSEPALCSGNKACVGYAGGCQCAAPCGGGEFPCPTGNYTCELVDKSGTNPPETAGKRCVTNPCPNCETQTVTNGSAVECAPKGTVTDAGAPVPVCTCKGAAGCHKPCFGVTCDSQTVCTDFGANAGKCVTDNCWNMPCAVGRACNAGTCVDDPCVPNPCQPGQMCKPSTDFSKGECKGSCAGISCKQSEQCVDGKCEATGCATPCPDGKVCSGGDAGTCIDSKCKPDTCASGGWCNPLTGTCGNEPCSGVHCPDKQECQNGQCLTAVVDAGPDHVGTGGSGGGSQQDGAALGGSAGNANAPDAAEDKSKFGLATGGGGCACSVQESRAQRGAVALLIGMIAMALRRRRKPAPDAGSARVRNGGAK